MRSVCVTLAPEVEEPRSLSTGGSLFALTQRLLRRETLDSAKVAGEFQGLTRNNLIILSNYRGKQVAAAAATCSTHADL